MDKQFIATLRALKLQAQSTGNVMLSYLLGMAELEAEGFKTKKKQN